MKKSESIENLAKALVEFQKEVKNPSNTANNPFYKSKYAPLNEILNDVRPLLSKCGLSVFQSPSGDGENIVVTTMLLHESGEWIEAEPLILKADKPTAQGAGSAITYARRYALSAILGISSEDDDDGNHASNVENKSTRNDTSKIDKTKVQTMRDLVKTKNVDEKSMCNYYKVNSIEDMTIDIWSQAMSYLKRK